MKRLCIRGAAILGILACITSSAWGQTVAAQTMPVEMPIRGGEIVVKVPGFDAARSQVLGAASAQGAELLDARTLVDAKGRKHGWLRLRLPSAHLPALLDAVQGIGPLYGESIATSDHASEYEELARRIFRLRQHEARLSGILESGRRLRGGDLLYVQERLFRASVDESLLAQRRADLERDTQLNTLKVQLFEPGSLPPGQPMGRTPAGAYHQVLGLARASLDRQLDHGAGEVAYGVAFAPLWLPLLLVLTLAAVWIGRQRAAAALWLRRALRRSFRRARMWRTARF